MSFSVSKIPLQEILTPDLTVSKPRDYQIIRGPVEKTSQVLVSSSYSASNVNFNFNTPSPASIPQRNMMLEMSVQLTFAGTSVSGNLLQIGTNDGPRQFPINTCLTTVSALIDNATVTMSNQQDIIPAISRCISPENLTKFQGLTPSYPDQFQNYSDSINLGLGTLRNPLNSYGNSALGLDPRGGFQGLTVISNTGVSAVVQLVATEPFFGLSPFTFSDCSAEAGFIGVQTFQFQINFGDLTRMWSHSASGNTITSVTATLFAAPRMLVTYSTAPELFLKRIEYPIKYPYYQLQRFTNPDLSLAPGAIGTITTNNIQVSSIPSRFYIVAPQRAADRTFLSSDAFASLEAISVSWNNKVGILASASKTQLYNISNQNGVNMSWNQWATYCGSVARFEMGSDIPLGELETPGQLGTYQLQVTMTLKNQNTSNTIVFTPTIIIDSEGIATFDKGIKTLELGVISKQDVLKVVERAPDYKAASDYIQVNDASGGDLLHTAKRYIPLIGKLSQLIETGVQMGRDISEAIGDKEAGGAKLSRKELKSRSKY